MAEQSKIEWCDASFNPWWGCERVSPACAHCYADTFAIRLGMGDLWRIDPSGKADGSTHGFRFFGDKHWDEPLKWARMLPAKLGRRPRVFCASMADVFEERPELEEHRDRLFGTIEATPELDWLILTKRPEFARDDLAAYYSAALYDGPLPNVWMGVSIENARYTWRADVLRQIPAAVRFISAEPLLGSLYDGRRDGERSNLGGGVLGGGDLRGEDPEVPSVRRLRSDSPARASGIEVPDVRPPGGNGASAPCAEGRARPRATAVARAPLDLSGIDWVIIGGESGPKARPFHLEHARELLDACYAESDREGDSLRPAVFVKQLGAKPMHHVHRVTTASAHVPLKLRDRKGGDMDEWPADLRIREFPASALVAA